MSATTPAFAEPATAEPAPVERKSPMDRHGERVGYTNISHDAMEHLAATIAAEAFAIPRSEVHVRLGDKQGYLTVSLALAFALDSPRNVRAKTTDAGTVGAEMQGKAVHGDGTVFDRAATARSVVKTKLQGLAGKVVNRVDVRFTGIHGSHQSLTRRVV